MDTLTKFSRRLYPERITSKHFRPCSKTTLTGKILVSHKYPPVPRDGKQTGSPLDQWDMVRMKWDCRLSSGLSPSSQLCQLWSWKGDLQRAWNQDRRAVWSSRSRRLTHCPREAWWSTHWRAAKPLAYKFSAQSLVKHLWRATKPVIRITSGSPM